ncbi:hypothetical protein [Streptomyces sp. NPDC091278]|uniref:zinc finger domain-containing protein n=1 Tax=Streptomyces sp. NPDC091278 TaxID=3155301 RepID=UPI00344C1946
MSRSFPSEVRERARQRTCPECRARPGDKCAPDRAGRSQLHRGRLHDAQASLQPLPPHQLLTPTHDRHFNEVNPGDRNTLVVS